LYNNQGTRWGPVLKLIAADDQYHRLPPANNIHIYSGNLLQHNTAGQHACIGVAN